jgi:mRNA-degrading endonuclease RelE of RelBE toxin-antitoxin system
MSFEVLTTDEFEKDVKRLSKKYKRIKTDILEFIQVLEQKHDIGVALGSGLYKARVKNSDIGGKRGGYRVIYYF